MMKSFFFLIFISLSIAVVGQTEVIPSDYNSNIKYYKKYLYKSCSEKSAVYKSVTEVENGIKKEVVTHIKSGQIRSVEYRKGHAPVGIWKTYDSNGKLVEEIDFTQILIEKCPIIIEDTVGYVEPQYPGGEREMYTFLGQTLRYPPEARDHNIQGIVYFCVYFDEAGEITVNSAIQEASLYLIVEGKRVLELMDNWEPATRNGVAVESYMVIPIVFKLQ